MRLANHSEHVSIEIGIITKDLAASIKEKLCNGSPSLLENCIFKVPTTLTRHKENFFEPKIVSIGPYHHGNDKLRSMEQIKLWYLHCLLSRLPEESLEQMVESIKKVAHRAINYYAENVYLSPEFIEMMVVDGCFLIELFRRDVWLVPQDEDDQLFNTSWMLENLYHDLILLENQIPWFILQLLFDLTTVEVSHREEGADSLAKLVLKFFEARMLMTEPADSWSRSRETKHILDLLHSSLLFRYEQPKNTKWELFPPVTDLLEAGVKFRKGNSADILNIEFMNGVLEIPLIKVLGNSESLFHNLIAYEHCDGHCGYKFTSYAVFLDCLINTSNDVKVLCEKGIIAYEWTSEDVSLLFNRLYNDSLYYDDSYGELSQQLNRYYRDYRSEWSKAKAILRRDYFNSPWSYFSFGAAVVILILTFLQTLFSILSY